MHVTFAIFAAVLSVASAAPATMKRQNNCPLQNFAGITITAPGSGKVRWDVSTDSNGLVQPGDLQWFNRDQPNDSETFVASVGSQPNLFTFELRGAQPIGLSGTELLASNSPATLKVTCNGGCNDFASGNDLVGDVCTFEQTDGTNGLGQCITFEAENTVVQLQPCQAGNPGQNFGIFSVA
ncbi:hypothetical protein MVEN_01445000 [Mycena venus]|uniref:Uncharacterized protein n=1 Tax=Mycena venus TaxID=2733690 RepID=A0A8H6XV24_9AGAR|nr:hypothetical protein MVEN_01445000 [Mycena venus]